MSTSAISGTVLDVEQGAEKTILRLVTGGNGSKREENVILPGRKAIASGNAVRLVNFIRDADGALVPGDRAKIAIMAKAEAKPAAPASPPPAQTGALMAFENKATRKAIFSRAVDVAREFAEHIRKAQQIVMLEGRPYVTVAGWAILPGFENAKCHPLNVRIESDGTVVAEAVVEKDGQIVSRGFGACSPEEAINSKKKGLIIKKRPILNDRMAMAQTRARGAALKSRYSVLVTLAGYEPSIADEVQDVVESPAPLQEARPSPAPPFAMPSQEQVAFALKIFENDKQALLKASADCGALVFDVHDIPVVVLKKIVEQRVNDRKRRRAESAAAPAA